VGGKGILIQSVLRPFRPTPCLVSNFQEDYVNTLTPLLVVSGGARSKEKKTHWVSWEAMTRPKHDGGLGLGIWSYLT
jgi:hypothetical protein